jgi:hypothetical protein
MKSFSEKPSLFPKALEQSPGMLMAGRRSFFSFLWSP